MRIANIVSFLSNRHYLLLFIFCLTTNLIFLSLAVFQDCLRACQEMIEQALATHLPQSVHGGSQHSVPQSKCEETQEHPTTPTDVRDIRPC